MHLTPEMLASSYDFLRTCPPFKSWKLPHSEEVEFRVIVRRDCEGQHNTYKRINRHCIDISTGKISYVSSLMAVMAHEMIHAHQAEKKTFTHNTQHNAEFKRLARIVCKHHGFDPKLFV